MTENKIENGASGAGQQDANPSKKRSSRKLITVGVAVAIVVIAGAGAWVWHEQPSFCNAICHNPMDSYVEEYYAEDSDKLSHVHQMTNTACLDCHVPTLDQQVSEAMKWVSDDFSMPLESEGIGTAETCLTEGCHDFDEIVASTEERLDGTANPHYAPHVMEYDCEDCHSMHGQSYLACNDCHHSYETPEGWTSENGEIAAA